VVMSVKRADRGREGRSYGRGTFVLERCSKVGKSTTLRTPHSVSICLPASEQRALLARVILMVPQVVIFPMRSICSSDAGACLAQLFRPLHLSALTSTSPHTAHIISSELILNMRTRSGAELEELPARRPAKSVPQLRYNKYAIEVSVTHQPDSPSRHLTDSAEHRTSSSLRQIAAFWSLRQRRRSPSRKLHKDSVTTTLRL
jgi:hypothetical protein